jgi:signal transduction histidine kinase
MTFKASNTVREIAHQLPSSIRIFDDLGIDSAVAAINQSRRLATIPEFRSSCFWAGWES